MLQTCWKHPSHRLKFNTVSNHLHTLTAISSEDTGNKTHDSLLQHHDLVISRKQKTEKFLPEANFSLSHNDKLCFPKIPSD